MREHGNKTTLVFLPTDGEASWSLLPSSVSLLSGSTVQPGNTYSCIHKVTGQVQESQKRISKRIMFSIRNSNIKFLVKKILNCFVGINFLPSRILDSLQNIAKISTLKIHTHKNLKIECVKFFGKIGSMLVAELAYVIIIT